MSQLLHRDPMPYSAYECHKLKVNENSIEIETGRDLFFDKFQVHPLISIEIILSVTWNKTQDMFYEKILLQN